jgi:cellulose synthase/poly-beta-1,6-N-acetylglucosamine synthase-like glycosyltransferase
MSDWLAQSIRLFDVFILWYFFALNANYFLLCLLSFHLIRTHLKYTYLIGDGKVFRTAIAPSLSVICPAYNEESTIVDTLKSLLTMEYPRYEVVVVNDGSSDGTLDLLKHTFGLRLSPRAPSGDIPTARVRGIYRSEVHQNLVVVDKESAGKADSLNAGINFTRNPLFCAIDADSILEPDAMVKLVRPFIDDPDTVAAGGVVRIVNGSSVRHGRVEEPSLPRSHLARFQVVEYFRAFLFGRVGWAAFNALPIVSGAFGLFSRRTVLEIGGYSQDTIGEDMDLVMRMHRHQLRQKRRYRIAFVPEPVCWTQVPEDLSTLARQRNRWQRGLIESLQATWQMFLNPRYGKLGVLTFPFFVFFEMLGPVVETLGLTALLFSLAYGLVDEVFAAMFFCVAVLMGIVLSLSALVLEGLTYRRYSRLSSVAVLLVYGVLENFGYRQLSALWRLKGIWDKLLGRGAWGEMKRRRFRGPSRDAAEEAEAAELASESMAVDEPAEELKLAVGQDWQADEPDRGAATTERPAMKSPVAPRVGYLVERASGGIRVAVKGRPDTAEVIPLDKLGKGMVTRAAYDYTDRHLGPRAEIGDKGKSLARRLRAALAG